ncbi:sensor histidine kinase [Dokdonia sp. 4H-3-7-5]|uniref:sensor histidine kinase n=1 Tax=Dokdonia sp. (strain 4H-3-7-5) TaxID=983548 RepID=UPI00020A6876|nr:GAF domain-containing sensor histidine kinase [Dokdonia sp. 4H-3-7-5]AEE20653.1 GAF sensor signal transduction histidine kinase [Dokdonia sp. 4H-3-7-5]
MIAPQKPINESKRLEVLKSYKLLDTLPEDAYDTITKLASHICNTPISLVTLLDADRNFLKSRRGIDMSESPRDISFCGHAILTEEPIFLVEDARLDKRFQDNPLVKDFKAIFYAGVPLRTSDGYALGTLCVYDHKPRTLSLEEQDALRGLAKQTVLLFEARKRNMDLAASENETAQRNDRLEDFARLVAHDLKSPLASIEGLLNLLKEDYLDSNDEDFALYLKHLDTSAKSMRGYIDGLLDYYRADTLLATKENTTLFKLVKNVADLHKSSDVAINVTDDIKLASVSTIAIDQIISNLVDNATKYNDKDTPTIQISATESKDFYTISVKDNGTGIPEDKQDIIFDLFKTTGTKDRNGKQGSGMGLATVRKLVEGLGGTISVSSVVGEGSIFTFTIRR